MNGRSDGRKVTCLQKFLGWIDNQIFLALGLRARVARALLQFFFFDVYLELNSKSKISKDTVLLRSLLADVSHDESKMRKFTISELIITQQDGRGNKTANLE